MNLRKILPAEIIEGSVIFPLLGAYDIVARELELATGLSQTRLMILILFRGGVQYNQNQVATALGADRTVVHRVLKTMLADKLLIEKRVEGRRAISLKLSAKGEAVRLDVIKARRQIDAKLARTLDARALTKLLGQVETAFSKS